MKVATLVGKTVMANLETHVLEQPIVATVFVLVMPLWAKGSVPIPVRATLIVIL